MKLENPLSQPVEDIFAGGGLGTDDMEKFYYEITGIQAADADFTVELNPLRLDASETDSFRIIATAGDSTPTGNYFLTFNWENSNFPRNYSQAVTIVVE